MKLRVIMRWLALGISIAMGILYLDKDIWYWYKNETTRYECTLDLDKKQ
jgi:hypothetical protein